MDVLDVTQVDTLEPSRSYVARRVLMPTSGFSSWTVVGPDRAAVPEIESFLAWITNLERSPNTIEAYARDLRLFWSFLYERNLGWEDVEVDSLGDFVGWARQPFPNVAVVHDGQSRRSPRSVNRALTSIVAFYEFQARRGNKLAKRLVVETRRGTGGYKGLLHGLGRQSAKRGQAVRLREKQARPKTLTLEKVSRIIEAQDHLRDKFLFALLASTGMRIGQALSLRHEDIVSWERRIVIAGRSEDSPRARSKGGNSNSIPVSSELLKLWNDYMHEEYVDLDSAYVFVNLFSAPVGRRMSYPNVNSLVLKTRRKVGFDFTPHQLRHTYATLAYRDGVAVEVIAALLSHRSVTSTMMYTHPTADDLRRALNERGVLKKVSDLVA